MSQVITIATAGRVPDAKVLKLYPKNQVPEKRRAPIGEKTAEATTASGAVIFPGVPDGQEYVVSYEYESGKFEYPFNGTAPKSTQTGYGTVASANTITLPGGTLNKVTGTTEIKKITATTAGTRVTLVFEGVVKVVDGENLKLAGNFETTADDTLTLVCDGTNWFEEARAVN